MTEREAFEAYVFDRTCEPVKWTGVDNSVPFIGAFPSAGNVNGWVRSVWEGWQAAAARYEGVVDALRPFAALADLADKYKHEDNSTCEWRLKASDLRRARQALAALDGAK